MSPQSVTNRASPSKQVSSDPAFCGCHTQCRDCNKTFARFEHLERHQRLHTNERPFLCPRCEQAFQRSDLRAIHVKKSHGIDFSAIDHIGSDTTRLKRKRIQTACDPCRKRKLRCDGRTPCGKCRTGDDDCQYQSVNLAAQGSRGSRPSHVSESPATSNTLDLQNPLAQVDRPTLPPTNISSCAVTFGDANLQQAQMPDCLQYDYVPVHNNLVPDTYSMTAALNTDFDIGVMLQPDATNFTMPDFWQVPITVTESWWNNNDFDNSSLPTFNPNSMFDSLTTNPYPQLVQEYLEKRSHASTLSFNKDSLMRLCAPVSLGNHDLEVVNVFLNLFSTNVPRFFRLCESLDITIETRQDYVLAAAAVGGLYCTTVGSFDVSKSMYDDSRRLLLASIKSPNWHKRKQQGDSEVLAITKTFILHELFGLGSGDKQCLEYVESCSQDFATVLRALYVHHENNSSSSRNIEITHLIASLHILDCYRVCILQRPPSLHWQHLVLLAETIPAEKSFSSINDIIVKLLNPGCVVDPLSIKDFSLASLSGLSSHLWRVMPLIPADKDNVKMVSKSQCVELASDKWFRSHLSSPEPAARALYHLMNICMHANLLIIQKYAHQFSRKESKGKENDPVHASILRWVRGRHFLVAKWHAEKILECVSHNNNALAQEDTNSGGLTERQRPELPPTSKSSYSDIKMFHIPYAIYYAALVLWCDTVTANKTSTLSGLPHLARGRSLLSKQKLRIATLLGDVLGRMETVHGI